MNDPKMDYSVLPGYRQTSGQFLKNYYAQTEIVGIKAAQSCSAALNPATIVQAS